MRWLPRGWVLGWYGWPASQRRAGTWCWVDLGEVGVEGQLTLRRKDNLTPGFSVPLACCALPCPILNSSRMMANLSLKLCAVKGHCSTSHWVSRFHVELYSPCAIPGFKYRLTSWARL